LTKSDTYGILDIMDVRAKYQRIFDFYEKTPQMLFISGPRQCGKTTFVKKQLHPGQPGLYLNWDIAADRKAILTGIDFSGLVAGAGEARPIVILDEIHKYSEWKNLLKGLYDQYSQQVKFLITGSGRLDFFQKGKDSLAGRYYLFHMWPLTIAEFGAPPLAYEDWIQNPLLAGQEKKAATAQAWNQLSACSGFPDPFFSGNEKLYRVWSDTYRNQLIREDVRQLTRLEKIDLLERLVLILPHRVGATLSMDNLAQDLQVAFDTVKKWLLVLERFYVVFRLAPWTQKISRAISKEQKLYLFDYALIQDPAAKFENMVALDLLRAVHGWREQGEGGWDLQFIRDRNRREVDFLLVKDRQPFLLIETKLSDVNPSEGLLYFQGKLNVPAVQLVAIPGVRHLAKKSTAAGHHGVLVCTAQDWLAELP
jgi:predicted AAA+ superfamily ATPase